MHINLERHDLHSIQSYDDAGITVNQVGYTQSVILSRTTIISDWSAHASIPLDETQIQPLLALKPELIIMGHTQSRLIVPPGILETLSKLRIGFECMQLGAACRTFNVLLSEHRAVVLGLIL